MTFACVLLALSVVPLSGEPGEAEAREVLRRAFERRVTAIAEGVDGVVGVTIRDLETNEELSLNGDLVFTQASAIKLPILYELFRQAEGGGQDLDASVTFRGQDVTPGSGVLQQLTPGRVTLTLRDVATLMITVSDNSATNMIIDRVGMENVNATMSSLGLTHTRLQRKMMDRDAWVEDRENLSTPNEQARLLEHLHRRQGPSPESSEEILRILSIPKSSRIRSLLPPGTRVAHKTGSVSGVVVDVGIVYLPDRPFLVSAMVNWAEGAAEAERAIGEIALAAYEYFDRIAHSNRYGHRK